MTTFRSEAKLQALLGGKKFRNKSRKRTRSRRRKSRRRSRSRKGKQGK